MNISARDIQLLVAGALASAGFYALVTLPYYIFPTFNEFQVLLQVTTAVKLLLGIGIFFSRSWAVWLTKLYISLFVLGDVLAIPFFYNLFPTKASHMILIFAPSILVAVILLLLLYWSGSPRFDLPNTALEPTPHSRH